MGSYIFKDISVLSETGMLHEHMQVGVHGERIDYISTTLPEMPFDGSQTAGEVLERAFEQNDYRTVIDGRGKLLMPGFYNAHSHVPMTLLRGMGENLDLDHWLNDVIFPFESHLSDRDVYFATLLGIAEMLRFGTVSFTDMYYHSQARAQAILKAGIKANLGHSVVNFDAKKSYEDLEDYAINQELLQQFHGAANGKLLIDFNLHAEYTSTENVVRGLAQAAKDANVRMQVHVSETKHEVEGCKMRYNKTPVAYLNDCGLFDVPTTAAHCVWLEPADYDILAEKEVCVATCPASNAKLGSGICDVAGIRNAGISLALGTDGVASNNNHNMFKDLYLLALMQRAQSENPVGLSSSSLLEIAARNGALSQGRSDCGRVVEGARADLIMLDIDTPHMTPVDNMASDVVYSAEGSDVVLTMVDGEVLYSKGEFTTIDIERVKHEVVASRGAILEKMASCTSKQ